MGLVYGRLARVKQGRCGACGSAILLMAHRTTVTLCGIPSQLMDHGSRGKTNDSYIILQIKVLFNMLNYWA